MSKDSTKFGKSGKSVKGSLSVSSKGAHTSLHSGRDIFIDLMSSSSESDDVVVVRGPLQQNGTTGTKIEGKRNLALGKIPSRPPAGIIKGSQAISSKVSSPKVPRPVDSGRTFDHQKRKSPLTMTPNYPLKRVGHRKAESLHRVTSSHSLPSKQIAAKTNDTSRSGDAKMNIGHSFKLSGEIHADKTTAHSYPSALPTFLPPTPIPKKMGLEKSKKQSEYSSNHVAAASVGTVGTVPGLIAEEFYDDEFIVLDEVSAIPCTQQQQEAYEPLAPSFNRPSAAVITCKLNGKPPAEPHPVDTSPVTSEETHSRSQKSNPKQSRQLNFSLIHSKKKYRGSSKHRDLSLAKRQSGQKPLQQPSSLKRKRHLPSISSLQHVDSDCSSSQDLEVPSRKRNKKGTLSSLDKQSKKSARLSPPEASATSSACVLEQGDNSNDPFGWSSYSKHKEDKRIMHKFSLPPSKYKSQSCSLNSMSSTFAMSDTSLGSVIRSDSDSVVSDTSTVITRESTMSTSELDEWRPRMSASHKGKEHTFKHKQSSSKPNKYSKPCSLSMSPPNALAGSCFGDMIRSESDSVSSDTSIVTTRAPQKPHSSSSLAVAGLSSSANKKQQTLSFHQKATARKSTGGLRRSQGAIHYPYGRLGKKVIPMKKCSLVVWKVNVSSKQKRWTSREQRAEKQAVILSHSARPPVVTPCLEASNTTKHKVSGTRDSSESVGKCSVGLRKRQFPSSHSELNRILASKRSRLAATAAPPVPLLPDKDFLSLEIVQASTSEFKEQGEPVLHKGTGSRQERRESTSANPHQEAERSLTSLDPCLMGEKDERGISPSQEAQLTVSGVGAYIKGVKDGAERMESTSIDLSQEAQISVTSVGTPLKGVIDRTEAATINPSRELELAMLTADTSLEGDSDIDVADDYGEPSQDSRQESNSSRPVEDKYYLKLQETISLLSGKEDPPSRVLENDEPSRQASDDNDDPLLVQIELNKLPVRPTSPSSTPRYVPPSSHSSVIHHPSFTCTSEGTYISQGIQVESGMILDREVLDSYLNVRMEESLFDLREQLRAMEQKISTALHERDSLERTLAEKVHLIKTLTRTGFKLAGVSRGTMVEGPVTCDVGVQAKRRGSQRNRNHGVSVSTQTLGIVHTGPPLPRPLALATSSGLPCCLMDHSDSELSQYFDTSPDLPLVELPGQHKVISYSDWVDPGNYSLVGCSRCTRINPQMRLAQSYSHKLASRRKADDEDNMEGDSNGIVSLSTQPLNWSHLAPFVKQRFETLLKISSLLKEIPVEPLVSSTLSQLSDYLDHLIKHLPSSNEHFSISPSLQDLQRYQTPGVAMWVLGNRLIVLAQTLDELGSEKSQLPAFFRAEIRQVLAVTRQIVHFLTRDMRHAVVPHKVVETSTHASHPLAYVDLAAGEGLFKEEEEDFLSTSSDSDDSESEVTDDGLCTSARTHNCFRRRQTSAVCPPGTPLNKKQQLHLQLLRKVTTQLVKMVIDYRTSIISKSTSGGSSNKGDTSPCIPSSPSLPQLPASGIAASSSSKPSHLSSTAKVVASAPHRPAHSNTSVGESSVNVSSVGAVKLVTSPAFPFASPSLRSNAPISSSVNSALLASSARALLTSAALLKCRDIGAMSVTSTGQQSPIGKVIVPVPATNSPPQGTVSGVFTGKQLSQCKATTISDFLHRTSSQQPPAQSSSLPSVSSPLSTVSSSTVTSILAPKNAAPSTVTKSSAIASLSLPVPPPWKLLPASVSASTVTTASHNGPLSSIDSKSLTPSVNSKSSVSSLPNTTVSSAAECSTPTPVSSRDTHVTSPPVMTVKCTTVSVCTQSSAIVTTSNNKPRCSVTPPGLVKKTLLDPIPLPILSTLSLSQPASTKTLSLNASSSSSVASSVNVSTGQKSLLVSSSAQLSTSKAADSRYSIASQPMPASAISSVTVNDALNILKALPISKLATSLPVSVASQDRLVTTSVASEAPVSSVTSQSLPVSAVASQPSLNKPVPSVSSRPVPVSTVASQPSSNESVSSVSSRPVPVSTVASQPSLNKPVPSVSSRPVPVSTVASQPSSNESVSSVASQPSSNESVSSVASRPVAASPVDSQPSPSVTNESASTTFSSTVSSTSLLKFLGTQSKQISTTLVSNPVTSAPTSTSTSVASSLTLPSGSARTIGSSLISANHKSLSILSCGIVENPSLPVQPSIVQKETPPSLLRLPLSSSLPAGAVSINPLLMTSIQNQAEALMSASRPHFTSSLPSPVIHVSNNTRGLIIKWTFITSELPCQNFVARYILLAHVVANGSKLPPVKNWVKVGTIKPMPLPMAVTLTNFVAGQTYNFAVQACYKNGTVTASNYAAVSL